jgi:F-type H+-transporting ATPase subunit gamma
MATLEELTRHIAAAEDLQSVVGTMKAISVAGIRTHEAAEQAMRRYLATVESGLQIVLRALPGPGMDRQAGQHRPLTGVVVVGSEIGLCGAFNERLVSHALDDLATMEADASRRLVLVIGARAASSWIARAEAPAATESAPVTLEALADTVSSVITRLDRWREEQGVSRLVLFHHRPGDGAGATPERIDLWPIAPGWLSAVRDRPWPSRRLPVCSGTPELLFGRLIRQLLFARVYTAITRSRTAEHAERLAAMQAADRSIAEKLDDLRILYRQRRQDVITAELLDLIAGFEAASRDGDPGHRPGGRLAGTTVRAPAATPGQVPRRLVDLDRQ